MSHPDPASLSEALRLLSLLGQATIVMDHVGVITGWSPGAEQLYGWSAEEAIGQQSATLLVPGQLDQDVKKIAESLIAGIPWSGGFTAQHRDGSALRVLFTTSSVLDETGAITSIVTVASGLDAAIGPLLEHASDAVLVVGVDGLVHYVSPSVTHLFGWLTGELIGRQILSLVHLTDQPAIHRGLDRSPAHSSAEPIELRLRTRDGQWRWTEAWLSHLPADPVIRGTVLNLRDITDRRSSRDQLTRLTLHDPLTGLANRTLMVEQIEHARPRRDHSGALLLIDLDGLKTVSHRFGHAAGDELLRTTASRLTAALGVHDVAGRLGSGEFLVLAEEITSRTEAIALVERVQGALHQPIRVSGTTLTPTCSIGVTLLVGRRRAHELIREAGDAGEQARRSGVGRYGVFDGLAAEHDATGGLLGRLASALASDELRVHYQPIQHLASRRTVAVEALLRWQHPDRGLLSAQAFLPPAEQSDLIHELGAFVLTEACRQVASWPDAPLTLAVNISARQLTDRALVSVIEEALTRSGFAPQRLVLEITETALLADLGTALEVLEQCRARGITVSIDDFGTGFAGFGYLRDLPVDEIKIDRSFVAGLGSGGSDAAIIGGIIHMARGLGLRTTGEGIEQEVQAVALTELGCDLGQGYLWSAARPGPPRRPDLPAPRSSHADALTLPRRPSTG